MIDLIKKQCSVLRVINGLTLQMCTQIGIIRSSIKSGNDCSNTDYISQAEFCCCDRYMCNELRDTLCISTSHDDCIPLSTDEYSEYTPQELAQMRDYAVAVIIVLNLAFYYVPLLYLVRDHRRRMQRYWTNQWRQQANRDE